MRKAMFFFAGFGLVVVTCGGVLVWLLGEMTGKPFIAPALRAGQEVRLIAGSGDAVTVGVKRDAVYYLDRAATDGDADRGRRVIVSMLAVQAITLVERGTRATVKAVEPPYAKVRLPDDRDVWVRVDFCH